MRLMSGIELTGNASNWQMSGIGNAMQAPRARVHDDAHVHDDA
jgi:hypothetical protein